MLPRHALVVGGGIAGLATARVLRRQKIETDVVERAPAWSHPGAGMYLPANAVRALRALGLGTELRDRAFEIGRQRFCDDSGHVLLDVDLSSVWGAIAPCIAIDHRGLHEILREGVAVRLGKKLTSLYQDGSRVQVSFEDGETGCYDLVIGADGVRSWVRSFVFEGAAPRFVGQASWRFVVDGFPQVSAWTVRLGRGRAFLTIPLGGGRVYCYADISAEAPNDPMVLNPASLDVLFGRFAEPVPTLLKECLGAAGQPYFSPIEEVVQEPWARGNVVLVGDAAHATSPNMAEGAGMAVEDAIVLGETIAAGRPLADFEARRRPRVTYVQTQTHKRDRTRNLPTVVRNAALRLAGKWIVRGNYRPLRADP
jgi:FAD-dependent urate hydroxylase